MADSKQFGWPQGWDAPFEGGSIITPNDSTDLVFASRGIIIGALGTFSAHFWDGSIFTFASGALLVGVVYPFRLKRILSTGTTASPIIVLY